MVESVVPELPQFDIARWMDLDLMMATETEHTSTEFRGLLDQGGSAVEQVVPAPSSLNIIVGRPLAR